MSIIIPPFTSASDRGYKFLRVFDEYYGSRGGTIQLQVEGGVSPYTWEITGTDFTLGAAETVTQDNYVTVAEDAVLDDRETVTITDAEGSTAEIIVCTCNPYVCCEDPEYSFAIGTAPDELLPGREYTISVIGGCPRFHWEVFETQPEGQEEFYSLSRAYTNARTNWLAVSPDAIAETGVIIKISDDCGELELYLGVGGATPCCEDPEYSFMIDTDESPQEAAPSSNPAIFILGGCPPFTWTVIGTDFTLEDETTTGQFNTLHVGASACGTAIISITDLCDETITWAVRCTQGHWEDGDILCYKSTVHSGTQYSYAFSDRDGVRYKVDYLQPYSGTIPCNTVNEWCCDLAIALELTSAATMPDLWVSCHPSNYCLCYRVGTSSWINAGPYKITEQTWECP